MAGFYGRTGIEFTDTLTDGLANFASVVRPAAIQAVSAAAEAIRSKAYDYANVSPGVTGHGVGGQHMRDEIKVEVRETPTSVSARIAIDMSIIPYAAHQEFGERGNRFMTRAVDDTRQDAHDIMREHVRSVFGATKVKTAVRFRRIA